MKDLLDDPKGTSRKAWKRWKHASRDFMMDTSVSTVAPVICTLPLTIDSPLVAIMHHGKRQTRHDTSAPQFL